MKSVDYLRSRSLPVLALAQSARIVFARHEGREPRQRKTAGRFAEEKRKQSGQLPLEGLRNST
jgi:hypothetical protein